MQIESLPTILTLLIALSVAAERAVEIITGFVPWLSKVEESVGAEARRRAVLHLLAAASGIAISWLAWPVVAEALAELPNQATRPAHFPTVLALGLLASGGSGFWHSILSYVTSLKELKQADSRQRAAHFEAIAIPTPLEGQLKP
jgi:hypothetical protein